MIGSDLIVSDAWDYVRILYVYCRQKYYVAYLPTNGGIWCDTLEEAEITFDSFKQAAHQDDVKRLATKFLGNRDQLTGELEYFCEMSDRFLRTVAQGKWDKMPDYFGFRDGKEWCIGYNPIDVLIMYWDWWLSEGKDNNPHY